MTDGPVTRRVVTLEDFAALKAGGYAVERFGRPGDSCNGWTLSELADGAPLMIGSHGCLSPTQWEAVAEGLSRIADDARTEAAWTSARIAAHIEAGTEQDARAEFGDVAVDAWFRAEGCDPDAVRGHELGPADAARVTELRREIAEVYARGVHAPERQLCELSSLLDES